MLETNNILIIHLICLIEEYLKIIRKEVCPSPPKQPNKDLTKIKKINIPINFKFIIKNRATVGIIFWTVNNKNIENQSKPEQTFINHICKGATANFINKANITK